MPPSNSFLLSISTILEKKGKDAEALKESILSPFSEGQKTASALPFSRRAAKLVFCYLSRAQVFKFSLAAAAAFLRGKLTSHIFLV